MKKIIYILIISLYYIIAYNYTYILIWEDSLLLLWYSNMFLWTILFIMYLIFLIIVFLLHKILYFSFDRYSIYFFILSFLIIFSLFFTLTNNVSGDYNMYKYYNENNDICFKSKILWNIHRDSKKILEIIDNNYFSLKKCYSNEKVDNSSKNEKDLIITELLEAYQKEFSKIYEK